jgi:hypothetical protein
VVSAPLRYIRCLPATDTDGAASVTSSGGAFWGGGYKGPKTIFWLLSKTRVAKRLEGVAQHNSNKRKEVP